MLLVCSAWLQSVLLLVIDMLVPQLRSRFPPSIAHYLSDVPSKPCHQGQSRFADADSDRWVAFRVSGLLAPAHVGLGSLGIAGVDPPKPRSCAAGSSSRVESHPLSDRRSLVTTKTLHSHSLPSAVPPGSLQSSQIVSTLHKGCFQRRCGQTFPWWASR
ncbi:hypothetical protein QR685DRAFT_90616 [Neurospora intermedia]|uniref:Secreted protein n=1 Tax=Neurospora intermedia TaxID=5142 RepID=A0ABR3D2D3_NEUIN